MMTLTDIQENYETGALGSWKKADLRRAEAVIRARIDELDNDGLEERLDEREKLDDIQATILYILE
jgi:hypothetical protein